MTLALKLLPSLPKLDKDEFIKSYIQTQKAHAKTYATEGRSFSTSWDITPRKPTATTSNESRNVGFATPVLKARNSRRATGEASKHETAPGKTTDDIETARASPPTGGRLQRTSQSEEDAKKPSKSKRYWEKNRGADSNSDKDHVARLLERRERKRIKRAIMKPKEATESETASSNGNKRKKRKQAKDEKSKVPAGFALMHGFTATNVGKNRLTASADFSRIYLSQQLSAEASIERRSI
ncbi:hypothetical protein GGX14DRAFT_414565 [Mycena pura]|uniref:Uncharacterized protein n=1 Tax=Mycena pura TaxID=153505 RepID=A0AAD7E4Q3_9AGAR|nr:hypothetical protein GGX14DRAFT_414565 [Mycena pura]